MTRDERLIFEPLIDRLDVTVAGGDGQESLPGVPLDQPLRVAVTRGLSPAPGATVRFTTADGGLFVSPDPATGGGGVPLQVDVTTGDDGVATCGWQLDPTGRRTQRVSARLLEGGQETGPVLGFTASLSVADRVAFRPGSCTAMAGAETVQDALIRLADASVLVPVGGDGQIAVTAAALPRPVEVLVRGCGRPVPGATVRFATTEGMVAPLGGGPSGPALVVVAGGTGVARCRWQLGPDLPLQTLTATLLDSDGDPDPRALPLSFLAGVVPSERAVDRVELPPGTALTDGALVAVADLAAGAAVVLDGAPDPVVADGVAVTVTLDLPFPSSQSDRDLWPTAVAGTLPLALEGTVAVTAVGGAPAVGWSPSDGAKAFLDILFAQLQVVLARDRVRGHVRLAGSVLGPAAADVTRWFWLGQTLTDLVVVPHRDGRLRLPSAQRAVALSVSREALKAGLPAGVRVADLPLDLDGATRAARRIFNATSPRRPLRLVVDRRYPAAGVAIQAGLATVDVELVLLDADDPVAEATNRLGNGEIIDGVLTDAASVAPVEVVTGFLAAVPL